MVAPFGKFDFSFSFPISVILIMRENLGLLGLGTAFLITGWSGRYIKASSRFISSTGIIASHFANSVLMVAILAFESATIFSYSDFFWKSSTMPATAILFL